MTETVRQKETERQTGSRQTETDTETHRHTDRQTESEPTSQYQIKTQTPSAIDETTEELSGTCYSRAKQIDPVQDSAGLTPLPKGQARGKQPGISHPTIEPLLACISLLPLPPSSLSLRLSSLPFTRPHPSRTRHPISMFT